MEPKIRRKFKALSVTLTTSTSTGTPIRWDDVAGGTLLMPTLTTNATALSVWVSGTTAGPWGRLYDSSGSEAGITLSSSTANQRAYAIPDAAFGAGAIMLVSASTNSTAVATITLKT